VIAGVYNFTIYQGATFSREITVRDSDNDLFDFTNYTARMHIRAEIDSTETMVELTTENGMIELGGTDGTVTLTISSADTASMSTDGVYDLEIINNGGRVDRLLKGAVTLDLEVTR
jgi:hypothetical protein